MGRIVIVAGRYGTVDDQTGISYTEREYDYAVAQGIPTLAFVHESPGDIPALEIVFLYSSRHVSVRSIAPG